jgi:hypothetical protein
MTVSLFFWLLICREIGKIRPSTNLDDLPVNRHLGRLFSIWCRGRRSAVQVLTKAMEPAINDPLMRFSFHACRFH